jgi:hypothetical protein
MPLGIIEPKSRAHVPGTARLYDNSIVPLSDDAAAQQPQHLNLKHGDQEVLLVPQPSNNPNDPLNWPLWKRDLTLFVLCLACATCMRRSSISAMMIR